MLVRLVMNLKAKNGLGRFALSALPHYEYTPVIYLEWLYVSMQLQLFLVFPF